MAFGKQFEKGYDHADVDQQTEVYQGMRKIFVRDGIVGVISTQGMWEEQ